MGDVEPKWNEAGLVPAVVQDAGTGEVLMLAWMNAAAWQRTQATGEAHFWSRRRQALWHKGETSGNVQRVVEIRLDCDADAVLLRVVPAGPACHTGARSCFYTVVGSEQAADGGQEPAVEGCSLSILDELEQVIRERQQKPRPGSYTTRLFNQGITEIAKKVGEEAVEVVVAALQQSEERLVSEVADLLYHILVLLAARGVPLSRVAAALEERRQ